MISKISKFVKDPIKLTKRLIYVLIALVCILLISMSLLLICGVRNVFTEPQPTYIAPDFSGSPALLTNTLDFGDHYTDSTIFLGDYTTARLLELDLLSGGRASYQVWSGENGDIPLDSNIKNTSIYIADNGTCKPLSVILEERRPQRIIITLGISNGVSYCDKDKFMSYYQSVIDIIKEHSPETIIILQSIFPITQKAEKQNPAISNDRIDRANTWICELAEKNGIHFLYTASILKDSNGFLLGEYAFEDGLNLDDIGYKTVLKYIRTHGTYEK